MPRLKPDLPSTPYLTINKNVIGQNLENMVRAFPDFTLAYAIKANPHEEIIELLHRSGTYFECASWPEIEYLLANHISAEKIIFSNPIKPTSAILKAYENNIRLFTVDSTPELEKFRLIKDQVDLLLRIQVSNEESIWPLDKKFGAHRKFWPEIFSYMQNNRMPLAGLTFHVGSQCESLIGWHTAFREIKQSALKAKAYGLRPSIINIGGGFPIALGRDIPTIDEIANVVYTELANLEQEEIFFKKRIAEPGRIIIGEAGRLSASVIGIAEREEGIWVYLDCGVFSGLMETIDGISYPIDTEPVRQGDKISVTLCGPSCDGLDKLFKVNMTLPKIGDIITFKAAGAYTTVYASPFNGFAAPAIYFTVANVIDKF